MGLGVGMGAFEGRGGLLQVWSGYGGGGLLVKREMGKKGLTRLFYFDLS